MVFKKSGIQYLAGLAAVGMLLLNGCQREINEESLTGQPSAGISSDSSASTNRLDFPPQIAFQISNAGSEDQTVQLQYVETAEPKGIQKHARKVYKSDNDIEVNYDAVTGQLVFFSRLDFAASADTITAEEATDIARKFMSQYCNLNDYTYIGTNYNENTKIYEVDYRTCISGIPSCEGPTAMVTPYGEIQFFSYHPYIFEGINTDVTINEQEYLDRVEHDIKEKYGDSLKEYTFSHKRLNAQDGKIIFEFFVAVDTEKWSYGETLVYEVS